MSIENEPSRNDECPCGSGLKSKKCCFANGWWYKKPIIMDNKNDTTFSNSACYAQSLSDCSTIVSKEHYISKSLLDSIGDSITISGFPWLEKGAEKKVNSNALTSKILCEYHNNLLSPLDSQATKFYQTIKKYNYNCINEVSGNNYAVFNNEDILKWMLKMYIGLIFSGNSSFRKDEIDLNLVKILFGKLDWPEEWNLYYMFSNKDIFKTGNFLEVLAFNNSKAIIVSFLGIKFLMCLGSNPKGFGRIIKNPGKIILANKKKDIYNCINITYKKVFSADPIVNYYIGSY